MPVLGKEFLEKQNPAEIAAREVEGYIERIEKQAETKPPQPSTVQPASGAVSAPAPVIDDTGKVMMQSSQGVKPTIVLPLDEEEVRNGLHHKVIDGIRWLAEWCIFIIKKYPGRVFYRQK